MKDFLPFVFGLLIGIVIGIVGYPFVIGDSFSREPAVKSPEVAQSNGPMAPAASSNEVNGNAPAILFANKMDVLYAGIDNPITAIAPGVPSSMIEVNSSTEGLEISKASAGKFNVKPTNIGMAEITLSGEEVKPATYNYRVKPIPRPEARLGESIGGEIPASTFRLQKGIFPVLDNFDFGVRCQILEYQVTRIKNEGETSSVDVTGMELSAEALALVKSAEAGDHFLFTNVIATCPGYTKSVPINSMAFKIK